eukprot:UC4_evm1s247
MISSMLLEVPNLAWDPNSKKIHSKPFRRQLDFYTKQPFTGPPENARDKIMAAAVAMQDGNWEESEELVVSLAVWNPLTDKEDIKLHLRRAVRKESLRTYLFSFSGFYDSLSLETLSDMFGLDYRDVHSIVSKMIINEELQASHDQPTKSLVIHKTAATKLQNLALRFADKATTFVENNERLA